MNTSRLFPDFLRSATWLLLVSLLTACSLLVSNELEDKNPNRFAANDASAPTDAKEEEKGNHWETGQEKDAESADDAADAHEVGDADAEEAAEKPMRVETDLILLYEFLEKDGSTISATKGTANLYIDGGTGFDWLPEGGLQLKADLSIETTKTDKGLISTLMEACMNAQALSVEVWFKPPSGFQGREAIVRLAEDAEEDPEMVLAHENGDVGFWVKTEGGSDKDKLLSPVSDALTHVMATWNQGNMLLYQNGKKDKELKVDGGLDWKESEKLMVALRKAGTGPWLGTLRLIAIYSRALSADEVQQNWKAGAPTK